MLRSMMWLVVAALLSSCANKALVLINSYNEAVQIARSGSGLRRFAIIQGPTSPDQTQVALLHRVDQQIDVDLGIETEGLLNWVGPAERDIQTFSGSLWQVSQFTYRGLKPEKHYVLRVMSVSKDLLDMREISTIDTSSRKMKFAMVSCMDDAYLKAGGAMWDEMLSHEPDVIFFLGDNVYADQREGKPISNDPKAIWERYAETRNALPIFWRAQLTPIIATWDDHDYGVNDGDRTFPNKEDSKRTFLAFFPQDEVGSVYERGEGVSSLFSGWGQQFILLDGRSFRTAPGEKMDSHWGKGQEEWLYRRLKKEGPPTWIFSGDQIFGKYHKFESLEGRHPQTFKRFMAQLKKVKPTVVFGSGDRHLTELMEIPASEFGLKTYELTSSAIHAKTFPDAWKDTPNPRKIEGASGTFNYAIVESEATSTNSLQLRVSAFGPGNRTLFDRKLSVGK